jgi:hypothetical protein
MKQFSLYDILGVLAPGVVVTVGVLALYPEAIKVVPNKEFSLGDSRKIVFQMAEVAVPRELFQTILERIRRLRLATAMSG